MAKKIVTEEIYNKIKPEVGNSKNDKKNQEKFGFGKTVLQTIRNTDNYQQYCERCFRFHGYPKRTKKSPVEAKTTKKPSTGNKAATKAPKSASVGGVFLSGYFAGKTAAEMEAQTDGDAELDSLIRGAKKGDDELKSQIPQTLINIEHASAVYVMK